MNTTINVPKKSNKHSILLVTMFLTGFSLFLYEVLLTRLFSVILSFNLVFLVVSFAILGSGIGGIWTHKKLKENENITKQYLLSKYSIGIPISILLGISLMYFLPFIPVYTVYAFIGAIPFVFGGIVISSIFMENRENSHNLYLMDLVGSGLGSLGFIPLMNEMGFVSSVIIICIITIFSSALLYIYCNEKRKIYMAFIGILVLGALVFQGNMIKEVEKNFRSYYSSPNTTINYLKDTAEKPLGISFSKWDAIAKTDVLETLNDKEKLIVTDGGATAPIVQFNGDLNSVEHMKESVNYIPFAFGKNDKSLVIGSGGGKDVLFALLGGSKEVHAVEINPSTIRAANYFKDYSGDIYNRPGVELHIQDGRNYVDKINEKYNNIYLSMVMTNAVENTMYSLAENYIYTTEAFSLYLDRLEENGKLSFMMHGSVDLLKIVNTGISVLLDKGVPQEEVTDYFVIVNGKDLRKESSHNSKVSMPLVIFKKEPFKESEIDTIKTMVKSQYREMLHYPGNEEPMLKLLKDKKISFEVMIDKINFNAKPITDNSPFFYNYSKFLPKEIQFVLFGTLLVFGIIRRKYIQTRDQLESSHYFMGLGIAFMLVEIPIIQKMILYFGNPSLAFSIILFSILLTTGIGSGLSGTELVKRFTNNSPVYLLLVAISVFLFQFNIERIMKLTVDSSFNMKILVSFITIAPMGLLMGIPFATGIRKLNESKKEDLIPLMWGVNGLFSVLGSALAVIISMKFGFNMTIYLGATIYLILFLTNPLKYWKSA